MEISQENFYDGVSFSKVTNLQCSDCNFAIKRTHHRFFLQYLPKTSCLKKNEKRKSLLFEKKVYDGPTPEQGCSAVVHNPQFYRKSRAHVRPSCRSVESSNILTGKTPQWSLFPEKLQV